MGMEDRLYETYEDCFRSLTNLGASEKVVTQLLDHERQHYEKAKELGYEPIYGIRMVVDCPPIIEYGFIDWKGKKPEGQDMIDILLAPDNPGDNDIKLAESIRSTLK